MPYIGRTLGQGTRSRFLYTATAGQTTFSGSDSQSNTLAYADNNGLDCFQNGVLLKGGGADYTATTGTSVVLTTGASVNDVIEILVYDVFAIADHVKKSGDAMTGALTNIDVNGTELILDADGDTSITADTDDQIDFKTGGSDRVTIGSTGNVGIGTSTIGEKLTVAGSIKSTSRAIGGSSTAGVTLSYDSSNSIAKLETWDSKPLSIETGGAERMRILEGGGADYILIGKTTTASGEQKSGFMIGHNGASGTNGRLIVSSQAHSAFSRLDSNGEVIRFFRSSTDYSATDVGSIDVTGSSTSYNTSSDYRLKENVVTDWDATSRLKQLKPSRFNFKVDKDTTVDGFLAHEVSNIVPEAVTGEKDAMTKEILYVDGDEIPEGKKVGDVKEVSKIDPQGIDQSKLVPLLTKALQEALARIETLEAKVTALEGK